MKDRRVRLAMNYGLDFQRIINSMLAGNGRRAGSFANEPGRDPSIEPFPYDPERASRLLAEAGYTDRRGAGFLEGPDGQRLRLRLTSPVGRYIKDVELAQAAASDWRRIGIQVDVVRLDWSVYAPQLFTQGPGKVQGDLFFLGAGGGSNCQGDLSDFYSKSGVDPGRWASKQFDAVIEELAGTFDARRALQLCHQAQRIMKEDVPIVFLYNQVNWYGVGRRVDWRPLPHERLYLHETKFRR
jgi:peptide/nickel transport system substrate-binding protein